MSRLAHVNAEGRIDVLAYRVAERLTQRHVPALWPEIERPVSAWCEKNLGPSKLGIAPLILVGGAAAATAAGAGTQYAWSEWGAPALNSWWTNFSQAFLGADAPSLNTQAHPNFQAPAAPQTPGKMTTWTPDDLAEATAQRRIQFDVQQRASSNSTPASPGPGIPSWVWIAAAAVGGIVVLRSVAR